MGFEATTTELRSDALTNWAIRPQAQLAVRANFVQLLQFHCLFSFKFHFNYCLRQSARLFWLIEIFLRQSHVCIGMNDTYGIHHWRILWSSYRKLVLVGFEPATTEFHLDALTDWAIRPQAQLTLRANFVQLLQFHQLFSVKFHLVIVKYTQVIN